MSQSRPRFISMDVHQDSSAVADVAQDHGAAVMDLGTLGTRPWDIDHLIRKRPSQANHLLFVYEAGPCGSWRYRDLPKRGCDCWVVAPWLIPQTPSAHVNTDGRDAVPLARLARSGDRTAVYGPTVAEEAMRDLSRARDDAIRACKDATCRLTGFLLRHDSRDAGRAHWHPAHLRWLAEVVCPTPAPPIVFQA